MHLLVHRSSGAQASSAHTRVHLLVHKSSVTLAHVHLLVHRSSVALARMHLLVRKSSQAQASGALTRVHQKMHACCCLHCEPLQAARASSGALSSGVHLLECCLLVCTFWSAVFCCAPSGVLSSGVHLLERCLLAYTFKHTHVPPALCHYKQGCVDADGNLWIAACKWNDTLMHRFWCSSYEVVPTAQQTKAGLQF
eukprot:1148663-Pelagomonas_calceolata.AAC.12